MDGSPQLALPRVGRGVKGLLIVYGVVGLFSAILYSYSSLWQKFWVWVAVIPGTVLPHAWTLLTAGLLTDPEHWAHLVFTLIGFYFLGPLLETRWGTWRLLRFVAVSIVAGFGLSLMLAAIAPPQATVFHPVMMFGPASALSALAVAWGRENSKMQINLFFVLPVSGRALVWLTLAFCGLGLFFPKSVSEGMASPFGGFIVGLLLAGSPSPLRELYLRAKLRWLQRRGGAVHVDLDPRAPLRVSKRRSGPPLRVVMGGVEDLDKRKPPKDKRYLN